MSPSLFRRVLGYAVAVWFGFALALYLLPAMVTAGDFCRRGLHCEAGAEHGAAHARHTPAANGTFVVRRVVQVCSALSHDCRHLGRRAQGAPPR